MQFSLFDDQLNPIPWSEAPVSCGTASPGTPCSGEGVKSPLVRSSPAPRPAPADALATLSAEAGDCRRCGLSKSRKQVVFGEGNPASPIVFVGEGPGETEDATGRPFVGRAGRLLDEALRRNGILRHHVYITNIIKCRAFDYREGRAVNRPPTAEEVQACRPWWEAQLSVMQPIVIVCIGGPSADTLIHRGFGISRERGRWFTDTGLAPWAMAVLHPAYILRQEGAGYDRAFQALVDDIRVAREKVLEIRRARKEAETGATNSQGSLFADLESS